MEEHKVSNRIDLHIAVKSGVPDKINEILRKHKDINLESTIFKKALQIEDPVGDTIFEESKHLYSKLLKVVNSYDDDMKSPLWYAVEQKHYNIACKLILHGAKVDSIPKEQQIKLLIYSTNSTRGVYSNGEHEYRPVVGLLAIKVPEGVTDFSVDYEYPRLFSYFLINGHIKVIDALLSAISDPRKRIQILNSPDNGNFPLNRVNNFLPFGDTDHLKCVKYLLENGATETANQICPINLTMMNAARKGHIETFKYFLDEANKCEFNTYIGLATMENRWNIIKFLWENYREHTVTFMSETALHYAAWRGTLDSIKYLCENGADVNCKNLSGQRPLDYARERGDLSIINYLSSFRK